MSRIWTKPPLLINVLESRVSAGMEESSEKRRERLRAMREEASLAGDDEGIGPSVANPPDASGLPLPSHLQQPPESPSSSFEFYTDPLAAFSGSQRNKKSRNSFGSSFPYPNHHPIPRGNFHPNSTPPGGFSTPSSSNPGSSTCGPRSAPYSHNGTTYTSSPASSHYNGGRGCLSSQSPQWPVGDINENCVPSHGSNHSRGSFRQSPASSSRGTPGKSGGRGFYPSQGGYSKSAAPESFAKRSMLKDPWKDLVPVRIESVAFRLGSCSVSSSQDWLPKSITRVEASPPILKISAAGPSLAESLAASFADAVAGEDSA